MTTLAAAESVPLATTIPDLDRMPADALLDARQLASILGCSVRHVRRGIAGLTAIQLGTLVRWRAGTVREYLRDAEARARRRATR